MKKYIKPETNEVRLKPELIICESTLDSNRNESVLIDEEEDIL